MSALSLSCIPVFSLTKTRNLTVRIDEETYQEIEKTADIENLDKSTVTRRLLEIGIRETKKKRALEMYREGSCTLLKAAEIAGMSLREMINLIEKEHVPLRITPDDVDLAWRKAFEQ